MDGRVLHHWWNGSWGRLNRRDVYIRSDGDQFELELRLGGSEGRRWLRTYDTYQNAVTEAEQHMTTDQRWTDVSRAHHTRNQ
ncbi:hypothetical protein ABT369_19680 [Dactylosporangium sp. NPDC000244]|uniref:hypothetical protein n=1 Tax=Dactylosporangium sp. NPDC000244 TaxID=3154365 RepID=UPI0033174264